jgi:hypothetical protein
MFDALSPLPADPILEAVKRAAQLRLDFGTTKAYQSPAGDPDYDRLAALGVDVNFEHIRAQPGQYRLSGGIHRCSHGGLK